MFRTLITWVEGLVARASEMLAEYLEAKPAPEGAALLPFADTKLENQMDVFARKTTAVLLYVGAAAMFLVPWISPRLAHPVGNLMQHLAAVLIAGL